LKDFGVGISQSKDIPEIAKNGYFSFDAEFIQKTGDDSGIVTGLKV